MERTSPEQPGWLRMLLLTLLSTIYLYFFLRVLFPVYDEGVVAYEAKCVADGRIPYIDFFEFIAPGSFYWPAAWFKLFGMSFATLRCSLLVTGVATVLLIDVISRRLFRRDNLYAESQTICQSRTNGGFDTLPALYALFFGIPFWVSVSHHWDSNLLSFLAVLLFLRALDFETPRRFFFVGVATGMVGAFMQQKGVFLFLAELFMLGIFCIQRKQKLREVFIPAASLGAGFGLVVVAIGIFFFAKGGLSDLIFNLFIFPIKNYNHLNVVPYGFGLWEFLIPFWRDIASVLMPEPAAGIFTGIVLIPLFALVALPVFCTLLLVVCFRYAKPALVSKSFQTCLILGITLWISEMHRKDYYHILFAAPLLFTTTCYLLASLGDAFPRFVKNLLRLLFFSALLSGLFNVLPALTVTREQNTRQGSIRVSREEPMLDFLRENCQEGEEVFFYPYSPMLYFLGNVKNPTRFNVLFYGFHPDEQMNEVVRELEQKKVRYIFWDAAIDAVRLKETFPNYVSPPKEKQVVEQFIEREYKLYKRCGSFRVMVRR
ncbi:MAG: hypothetical protein WA705_13715 [Candidatus Ozemobacteraceae bacterium]